MLILSPLGSTINLQNLKSSVTVKENRVCRNKEIKITACEDSYIFIDASVSFVSIINCINCTIYVGAVSRVTTIDKCEKIKVTIASNFLRIGNTIDSRINYYGAYAPVLYGDNRSITIGPYNSNCIQLVQRMKESKLKLTHEYVSNFMAPVLMNKSTDGGYRIQSLKDYEMLAMPNHFFPVHHTMANNIERLAKRSYEDLLEAHKKLYSKSNMVVPFLAPLSYKEKVINAHMKFNDTFNKVKNSGLKASQQKTVQMNIQGYFKEWLIANGHSKQI